VEVTGVLTDGMEFVENAVLGGTQRVEWGGTGGGGVEAGGRDSSAEGGWSVRTIGRSNPSISVLTFKYHV
jgi:hypothetical protein